MNSRLLPRRKQVYKRTEAALTGAKGLTNPDPAPPNNALLISNTPGVAKG